MAAATATKATSGVSTDDLLLLLATEGDLPLSSVLERVPESMVGIAWAKGQIEIGRTKYCMTGNPESGIRVHNGVNMPPATLVIESGIEWSGPKQRWHQPFSRMREEPLPAFPRYQKYQLEVCVNKEKDVWEWLEEGKSADGRETRYARRDINRAEAERLLIRYVRLTESGAAGLQS